MKPTTLASSFLLTLLFAQSTLLANVSVKVDFTDPAQARGPFWDMWDVANRISPVNGVLVRPGMKVNTVRMIGGILKRVDGKPVPDIDFDTATYDQSTGTYVYHFDRLFSRIDAILEGGTPIHQMVLDQPPWAFHHGYTFIPEGTEDGVNFRENERLSIYGNPLPPADKEAYSKYLTALMQALVDQYGEELVMSWRFRIGSEIETPAHWYGTEQDFIDFYVLCDKAVRSVLPDATIGLHTRHPDFVFRIPEARNYKGEVFDSFANGLIEYLHDHNIRYDFWGISDYPIISIENTRDPKVKFEEMFEPLVSHPKWRPGTVLDVHEFGVVSMIQDNIIIISESPQADSFMVALSDHFYEHGVRTVFQWNQREVSDLRWRTQALTEMVGKTLYTDSVTSAEPGGAETVGAIVTREPNTGSIDLVLHNYDPADLEAVAPKTITTELITSEPAGTTLYYRKTLAGKQQHPYYSFMEQEGSENWLSEGQTRYGQPETVLNAEGLASWQAYEHPTPRIWTDWTAFTTAPRSDGEDGSVIRITTTLPLFSYEKIEIRHPDKRSPPEPFNGLW